MEIRIQRIFLKGIQLVLTGVVLVGLLLPASAEETDEEDDSQSSGSIFDPQVERRDVDREAIDTENWEIGLYYGIISVEDFGSSELKGVSIAYHVTEDFFVDTSYAQTEAGLSSFERLNGNVVLLTPEQREYSHFNVSLGFNILPGEGFIGESLAFTSSLYLLTGLGSTDFAGV